MRRGHIERSPESVIDEALGILTLYREVAGVEDIGYYFMDASFGCRPTWLHDFCVHLCNRGQQFSWAFQTRVGTIAEQDYAMLRSAGCYLIHFGLESFSPVMLGLIGKTAHPAQYIDQFDRDVNAAMRAGVAVEYNILFGAPGETRYSLDETRRGIERMKASYPAATLNLNLFRLLPDTRSFRDVGLKHGSKILVPRWWEKGIIPEITVTVLPSHDISPSDLLEFYEDLYCDDACYRRRGSHPEAAALIAKGALTQQDMARLARKNRLAFRGIDLQPRGAVHDHIGASVNSALPSLLEERG